MTDRRRPATGQSGQSDQSDPSDREDNPFAPPPEDRPDQPWQPRHPVGGDPSGTPGGDDSRPGGQGGGGRGGPDDGEGEQPWGSQWSRQQPPGRQGGGFGQRPGGGRGDGPPGRGTGGMRWDPTDPVQRRARFALLAGMWGFFFGLFDFPSVALLLGALALYWGVSSLRAKPRTGTEARDLEGTTPAGVTASGPESSALAPGDGPGRIDGGTAVPAPPAHRPGPPSRTSKPQTTPAVMGLVSGGLAVLIVAATYSVQIIYADYYTCTEDALTTPARERCEDLLPDPLRSIITSRD